MLTLIGVAVIVAGFALRVNPLLVVLLAGAASGMAAGLGVRGVLEIFGRAFADSRYVALVWLVLPVVGVLERAGLRERAQTLVASLRAATAGRVLLSYLIFRQVTAALGLTSLGGHAQMVRPLVAPMAEGAAEARLGPLSDRAREWVRAHAAAVDNVGVFFGEDIFIAIGSILLIRGFLDQNGVHVAPLRLASWAIPTAVCALVVHGTRVLLLDRRLRRAATSEPR